MGKAEKYLYTQAHGLHVASLQTMHQLQAIRALQGATATVFIMPRFLCFAPIDELFLTRQV